MARGVAYARAKRALAKDTFVILDGMNYIKGYRYQLWCEAKAVGTTCCVVRTLCSSLGYKEVANDSNDRSTSEHQSSNAARTMKPS